MSNVLSEAKKQQVIALGKLGWPLRRIEQETGVRRETAGAHLKNAWIAGRSAGGWGRGKGGKKAAGIAVRPAGGWGRRKAAKVADETIPESGDSKPANEVITDFVGDFPVKP